MLSARRVGPSGVAYGLEGTLVNIGTGAEADFLRAGSSVQGAILVVHTEVSYTWVDLFNEYKSPPAIIERALKAGAIAFLAKPFAAPTLIKCLDSALRRGRGDPAP